LQYNSLTNICLPLCSHEKLQLCATPSPASLSSSLPSLLRHSHNITSPLMTRTHQSRYTSEILQKHSTCLTLRLSVKYEGQASDAILCTYDANGQLVGGQSGCYNVPSNCTSSAAMVMNKTGAASLKFRGEWVLDLPTCGSLTKGWADVVQGLPSMSTHFCTTCLQYTRSHWMGKAPILMA